MADAAFVSWEQRPEWEDIKPIPQADTAEPLVPINYSHEYANSMSAFRYILEQEEISERVLDLTGFIVTKNPAHYTVWANRGKTLLALNEANPDNNSILTKELKLLTGLVKPHLKNYQVWQHRRAVVLALNDPTGELDFTSLALSIDNKNYHTWAYRQWVLSEFYGQPSANDYDKIWTGELDFTDTLLAIREGEDEPERSDSESPEPKEPTADVRNNSAWNHRWFVVFRRSEPASQAIIDRETKYVKAKIDRVPNNASVWNYLRGILDTFKQPYSDHLEWARSLTSPSNPNEPIMLALEFEANALGTSAKQADVDAATALYEKLATEVDPMREAYWGLMQRQLKGKAVA